LDVISNLINAYPLGELIKPPTRCVGGLLHHSDLLTTSNGQFIVKYLNPLICRTDHDKARFCETETFAAQLSDVISVISALKIKDSVLMCVDHQSLMVFPYVQAKSLLPHEIKMRHIGVMASALAKIHQTHIVLPKPNHLLSISVDSHFFLNEHYPIKEKSAELAEKLLFYRQLMLTILDEYHGLAAQLTSNQVMSHRDCDPKNVLWDKKNQYYIIDWEYAGYINRTQDVLVTAIYWSLQVGFKLNRSHFLYFIRQYENAYVELDRSEIKAGLYGLLIDWLSWIELNMMRVMQTHDPAEYQLAVNQIMQTLDALPKMLAQFPLIMEVLEI